MIGLNVGDRVKVKTIGRWYNGGVVKQIDEDSILIEIDSVDPHSPPDLIVNLPFLLRMPLSSCADGAVELIGTDSNDTTTTVLRYLNHFALEYGDDIVREACMTWIRWDEERRSDIENYISNDISSLEKFGV